MIDLGDFIGRQDALHAQHTSVSTTAADVLGEHALVKLDGSWNSCTKASVASLKRPPHEALVSGLLVLIAYAPCMTGAEYTTNPLRWVLIEADPRIRERLERALNPWVGGIGVGLFEQFDAGAVDALSPQILFAPADPELWNQVDAQPGPIRWRIALGRTDSDARIMAERGIDGYLHWPFASEKLLALTARMGGEAGRPDRLWLKDGERWCLLDVRDVQFCEVKDRQLWVHTRHGPMQFSGSLASLEQRFPSGFESIEGYWWPTVGD